VAGGKPYGYAMIINVVFTILSNTGLFPDACHSWQMRSIVDKMWVKFKLDFAAAHLEFCLTNQIAQNFDFHSANMMIEQGRGDTMQCNVDAISHLAKEMASDRGTVERLSTTNANFASQLEAAQSYIKILKDEILALNTNIKPAWQGQQPAKSINNNNYYWSHDHQVHKDHRSATCEAGKEGYQEMATKDNTMGGNTW
jgi:hypothetical protein